MSNNRFKIKSRPEITIELWPYVFNFYVSEKNLKKDRIEGTYLRITSKEDRQFSINIPGNTEAYGFLLAAARQKRDDQLRDYARILFAVSMLLTTDQTFADNICEALLAWQERRAADGAKRAQEITDEQEQVAQIFMEDVAEYADAQSDVQRDELRNKWKDELKDELKAKNHDESQGQTDDIQGD